MLVVPTVDTPTDTIKERLKVGCVRNRRALKSVSKVGKFSDIACSVISRLVVGIFMPKNSTVTKFYHLALGGPVIMPHRVQ